MHSFIGSSLAVCVGRESVRAPPLLLDSSLNPAEPVSTSTPSIVWHFEVPGMHTVTLANAALGKI
jgi:hypothetical protein